VREIAIVPAKGKSRRCPEKNWKPFMNDESLAERKVITSMATGYFDHVILSVDFGPDDPRLDFLEKPYNKYQLKACANLVLRHRPYLMRDDSLDVVLDALDHVDAKDDDRYYLLQPTSPFLMHTTIHYAMQALRADTAHGDCAVVTVNPACKPSGGLYAGKVKNLKKYCSFFKPNVVTLPLDWRESVDIDEEYDFEIARRLME
jgi:CMP-N-acetylneuraminic acid synthetase